MRDASASPTRESFLPEEIPAVDGTVGSGVAPGGCPTVPAGRRPDWFAAGVSAEAASAAPTPTEPARARATTSVRDEAAIFMGAVLSGSSDPCGRRGDNSGDRGPTRIPTQGGYDAHPHRPREGRP